MPITSTKQSRIHAGKRTAILGYHKIGKPPGDWETWYYIPEATFVSHLDYLEEHDWQILDIAELRNGLAEPASLPERSALLTFDDGYKSIMDCAAPILARRELSAVLFMPSDLVGGRNTFDSDSEPDEALCDWQDLAALERSGISIESHGATHRAFSTLSLREQVDEARRSKLAIEERLAKSVSLISYPYGDPGDEPDVLSAILEEMGYKAGFLYGGGPISGPQASLFRLPRLALGPDSDLPMLLAAG